MAEQKKFVESITPRDQDFTQWYTDVCIQADLIAYSNLKGFMVIKPAGYAIWENCQKELDRRFKETGVQNVYMPLLIPENLMKKEGELVNGFAPEVAWVTSGGTEPLTERLCADGYELVSGPRVTGDGYYESCIVAIEGNLIELTV